MSVFSTQNAMENKQNTTQHSDQTCLMNSNNTTKCYGFLVYNFILNLDLLILTRPAIGEGRLGVLGIGVLLKLHVGLGHGELQHADGALDLDLLLDDLTGELSVLVTKAKLLVLLGLLGTEHLVGGRHYYLLFENTVGLHIGTY